MSKNTTRKGLALGAAIALVSAGFVSTPAFASTVATSVHLGSSYNTLVGSSNEIDLATQLSADTIGGTDASLKYRILNPSGATIGLGASNNGTSSAAGTVSLADGTDSYYSTATGAAITATTTTSTDFVFVPANAATAEAGAGGAYNILRIWATSAETATITVQAFLDTSSPSTHLMDSIEDKGPAVTVNLYKASAITWSTAIDKPAATDSSLTATITTSPALNGNYLNGAVTAKFTRQDSTAVIESGASTWSNVTNSWPVTVALDGTNNWVGLPNFIPVASESSTTSAVTVVTTPAANNLAIGDVVTTVGLGVDATGTPVSLNAASDVLTGAAATTLTYTVGTTTAVTSRSVTGAYVVVEKKKLKTAEATKTVATYETLGAHGLRAGDFVTIDATLNGIFDRTTRVAVASVPTTATFTVALATAQTAVTANANDTGLVTYDSFFDAFVGTYTSQAFWNSALQGAVSDSGTINVAAASTKVTTASSASVQGVDVAGAAGTVLVKAGTTSVPVTLTVLDADGDAVGAGHPVSVGTLTPTGPVTVNARSSSGQVLYTDANGQVTLTVATATGTVGHSVVVEVTPENVAGANAGFTMTWAAATVGLVDLNTTGGQLTDNTTYQRKVSEDGNYVLNLKAVDQWFTAADDANYRLLVSGDGSNGGVIALASGLGSVTISDLDIASTWSTVVKLQKASGSTWTTAATYTFANDDITSASITLGADGSNAYGNAADLSDAVAKKALLELDKRLESGTTPDYVNDVIVNGRVTNKSSGVALEGSLVTISGSTSILFSNGQVAKRGSITVLSDAAGKFEVNMYSTSGQTDSVITVTALGASSTTKVTFTGIGIGEGTVLTVTTPAAVQPASTFQVKAKLADVYGNGVALAAVKVTYTGAGIVFGSLPTATDANGELMFSVLLGSNDKGTVSVTVSYDQNADADYLDAKDLVTTSTTEITASGVASAAAKVNAGSFKGYVALYAKGYAGKRMSAKVGADWVVVASLASDFERVVEFTGAGVDVAVRIYIDRVLIDTINLTTK